MNHKRGLIRLIIVIIVGILALSYFGINLRQIANSEASQSNFAFVWEQILRLVDFIKQILGFLGNWFLQYTARLKDILG